MKVLEKRKLNFINKSNKKYNYKYDYSKVVYINGNIDVDIICPDHGIFKANPIRHSNRYSCCVKCSNKRKLSTKIFIDESIKIHGNKYNYDSIKFINDSLKVDIICPEHGIFKQSYMNHIRLKQGCPVCKGGIFINLKNQIKRANKIHLNKYNYSLIKEDSYTGVSNKVDIICPDHGIFKQKLSNHITSKQGCPTCNESRGEKEIANLLKENNIKFKREYKFKDCKNKKQLPFDFYLEESNTCIEFDGIQHFEPIDFFGGIKAFKQVQINDNIKTQYCLNNNIKLIRFKYNEKINIKGKT